MHRSRAFITSLIVLALSFGLAAPAFGATQAELDQHRQRAEDARKKAAQAETLAKKLAGEVAALD